MPPHADDPQIGNDQFLLRVLPFSRWIVERDGQQRPASESMMDSNFENSCFVEAEITREEVIAFLRQQAEQENNEGLLYQIEHGLRFARIPVALIREVGFIIERRPDEAAECAKPAAHVVIGPPSAIGRNNYERAARRIVKDPRTTIL